MDPVTFKVFTDNTYIVALKNTGNVFAYDTVERLNIKAKMWRDLISDAEFSRSDIITIQDPQNIEARDLSSFKHVQDGASTLTEEQVAARNDPTRNLNTSALGNAARILKAKEAVAKARSERTDANHNHSDPSSKSLAPSKTQSQLHNGSSRHSKKSTPYNAATHTTGRAAASFTSTGLTPHTSAALALLTDEEYLLKPRRVKTPGYAHLHTTLGSLTLALYPEFAPKAVWNFIQLSKKGYYTSVPFHRNIRNFMVQGGDPTGTGKGGASIWGKNFADEFEGPATHDKCGVVSMANKGKNTNGSQFFITYRPAKHLDRKHTIFGAVVGGLEVLDIMEKVEVEEESKRPKEDLVIKEAVVFVDPFEEFMKEKGEKDTREEEREVEEREGRDDDRMTWTGKRIRADGGVVEDADGGAGGVGKYLKGMVKEGGEKDKIVEEWEEVLVEPAKKKLKGGFGNFDSW